MPIEKSEPQPDGSVKVEKVDLFFQVTALEKGSGAKITPTILGEPKVKWEDQGLRLHVHYPEVWYQHDDSGTTTAFFESDPVWVA